MQQVEPSVSRHSESFSGVEKPTQSQPSVFDSIFPLFYELCQTTPFPNILYSLVAIYLYYQLLITSFWCTSPFWIITDADNEKYNNVFSYFMKIGWFFDKDSNLQAPTIVIFVLFAISGIWAAFVIIHYVQNHRIIHWTLYPLRFINEIVVLILLHPSAALCGSAIERLVDTKDSINWLYMFAGLLSYIFSITLSYLSISLSSSSVILSKTLFACFDCRAIFYFPLISSLYVFFSFLLSLFDDWVLIILQITHLGLIGLIFYYLFYLPFLMPIANVLVSSVAASNALSDIFMIIMYFMNKKDEDNSKIVYVISLIFPYAVFVIAAVVFYFVTKARIKKISDLLTMPTEEPDNPNASHELKVSIETSISLDIKNENQGLMYLYIGFTNILEYFYIQFSNLDVSIIQLLLRNFTSTRLITSIMHILTFVPCENRQVNLLYRESIDRRDLNLSQRFLLFQVNKIKTFRQSSVPSEANSRLSDLKRYSQQCQEDVYSFWTHKAATSGYFEMITNECAKTQALWEESLRDFPNNCKIIDEYIIFLAECETDVKAAIEQKNRLNSIEYGKNMCIDLPYRSFIRSYPGYLKKGILDIKGYSINKAPQFTNKTQQSANSNSQSSSSSMAELDAEIEETLGKQLFKQSPIRIAIYKALKNRTSYVSKLFLIFGAIGLVCGIGAFLGLFIYISNYSSLRRDALSYLDYSGKSRFYVEMSLLFDFLKYAFFTKLFNPALPTFIQIENDDISRNGDVNALFTLSGNLDPTHLNLMIHRLNRVGQTYFSQLLNGVADLSNNGEDIFTFAEALLVNNQQFYTCDKGIPVKNCTLSSLAALQVYFFFLNERVAGYYSECQPLTFFMTDPICEVMNNQPVYQSSFDSLFDSFNKRQRSLTDDGEKIINLLRIIIPILLIIVEFLPFMILSIMFVKDINKFISILLSLSSQVKEEAQQPILKDMDYDYLQVNDKRPKLRVWIVTTIICLIISIIIAILALVEVQLALSTNNDLLDLNNWQLLATLRLSYGVMGLTNIIEGTVLGHPNTQISGTNQTYFLSRAQQLANMMIQVNDILIKGTDGTHPCYGFDDELDKLNIEETCVPSKNMTDIHESYRCSSATTGVINFANMITTIASDPSPDGMCSNELIPHALHILNRHLYYNLFEVSTRINQINIDRCNTLKTNAIIFLIVGIALSVFIMYLSVCFYQQSIRIYGVGISLTRRLPPSLFATDKRVLHYIINKKSAHQEGGMSIPQTAINSSPEAIICTGKNGVIEIVNPAVTQTIGYSPDQLLGQPITSFFVEADGETITNQLELMLNPTDSDGHKRKNYSTVYHESLTCLSDSAQEVPCDITMIGMSDSNDNGSNELSDENKPISSFLFVIRDETSKIVNQEESNKVKQAAETLLYNILPKPFVERMSAGEDHIAFMAPLVTVCVIDVVKFTEFASTLPPQDIMSHLTTLIESFDKIANKYQSLNSSLTKRTPASSTFTPQGSNYQIPLVQTHENSNSVFKNAVGNTSSPNSQPKQLSRKPSQQMEPVQSPLLTDLQIPSQPSTTLPPTEQQSSSRQQPTIEQQSSNQQTNKNEPEILSLNKCGIVGDKYIVTAGLFSSDPNESGQETDPRSHIDQIIRFALECLAEIDEINMKLSLNLQIRIGLDTGGPIMAGIIGEGKPQFEIVGEPIGIAMELEENCFPGKILASQNTTNYINNASDFVLESKGKLALKGRGKTINVFNLSPVQNIFASSSSIETFA